MRGNELEKKAEKVNLELRLDNEALIKKVPTPMLITNRGVIPQASTVDFVGLIKGGKFIAFDTKQTNVKTRFDLKNIHQHQLEYLKLVQNLGGISFFLIWFKKISKEEAYIVPVGLVNYW